MVVLILLFTASSLALDSPERIVEVAPGDLLAELDESGDAGQGRVRGPLAQQWVGFAGGLFEDHPEAFLELVRLPEGLVGVGDAFQLGPLAGRAGHDIGGQVQHALERVG